jgi:hypothetical protein
MGSRGLFKVIRSLSVIHCINMTLTTLIGFQASGVSPQSNPVESEVNLIPAPFRVGTNADSTL